MISVTSAPNDEHVGPNLITSFCLRGVSFIFSIFFYRLRSGLDSSVTERPSDARGAFRRNSSKKFRRFEARLRTRGAFAKNARFGMFGEVVAERPTLFGPYVYPAGFPDCVVGPELVLIVARKPDCSFFHVSSFPTAYAVNSGECCHSPSPLLSRRLFRFDLRE